MSDANGLLGIKAAVVVVALESAALLAFGVAEFTKVDPAHASVAVTSGGFFVLYAAGLALAARALLRLRGWSRGPVVLAQFIQLGVAWSFFGHDTKGVAVLLAIAALGVLVVVLSPTTTDLLYGGRQSDEGDGVSSS